MSEVTTLKQLMLDAARYRWIRDNQESVYEAMSWDIAEPAEMDEFVDIELAKENP